MLAAGCAAPGLRPATPASDNVHLDGPVGECARLYRSVDDAVRTARVADAQAARIPGFPYLRIDRPSAAFAPQPASTAFPHWVDRLRALDREARQAELANLPPGVAPRDGARRLEHCATLLRRHDLASPAARTTLAAATVPDAYRPALRVLGLYPLVSVPFLRGVRQLHRETRATFEQPLETLPVTGSLRRWGPAADAATLSPAQVAALLARASDNPLKLPDPAPRDLRRLFATFAPIWEVDVASAADLPGTPSVQADAPPMVDGPPVVYTLASHATWQDGRLLQLNYVVWFPSRPRQGPLDLLGGRLDGLTWRVTLGPDGKPLLFDVMHNCGCYYSALPTPGVAALPRRQGWEEPISVPRQVSDGDGRLVLRLAATTHYLQQVYRDRDVMARAEYRLRDYSTLRSLPLAGGGRRSLFGPGGLVPGTQRRERWLFWPMGVVEPGAMRQWGHHAIAFVGRRHFDDPGLLARYFEPVQ